MATKIFYNHLHSNKIIFDENNADVLTFVTPHVCYYILQCYKTVVKGTPRVPQDIGDILMEYNKVPDAFYMNF